LTESRYGAVDNPGIDFAQFFIREPQAGHHARAEVFHNHVRAFDQLAEYLFSFLGFHV
jgi:hypothetical protein